MRQQCPISNCQDVFFPTIYTYATLSTNTTKEMPMPFFWEFILNHQLSSTKHHFSHMLVVKIAMQSFVLPDISLWHSVLLFHDSEINLKVDDVEHIRFCTINHLETLYAALGGESHRSHHIYVHYMKDVFLYLLRHHCRFLSMKFSAINQW